MSWKRWSGKIQITLKCYSNIMQSWNCKGPFYKLKLHLELGMGFRPWIIRFQPERTHLCEPLQEKGVSKIYLFSAQNFPLLNIKVNIDYCICRTKSKINIETNSLNCYRTNFSSEHYENSLTLPTPNTQLNTNFSATGEVCFSLCLWHGWQRLFLSGQSMSTSFIELGSLLYPPPVVHLVCL